MTNKIKIYIDFDGTISKTDALNHLLDAFTDGKWLPIDERYLNGEISSKECISGQVAFMNNVSTDTMLRKAEEVGIDPTFSNFVDRCRKSKIKTEILSDGLDFYIKHLLARSGVQNIPIKSNHYAGSGKVYFPYNHQLCEKGCGNCKKFHIGTGLFTVYSLYR